MATKRDSGSLSRVNQLVTDELRGCSSVFTLHSWTDAPVKPLGGRTSSRRGFDRGWSTQNRARLLLIKVQESALNFLLRWSLLDEAERQDRPASNQLRSKAYKARSTIVSSTTAPNTTNKTLKQTRSSLLMKDVARLSDRNWMTILKCIFWRWLTWTNVFELLLIILLTCCCAYQCYELLEDYYKYPTHVAVSAVFNDDFRADLPSVTICDNNRVSMSTIKKNFPHLNHSHYLAITLGTFRSIDNFSLIAPPGYRSKNDWTISNDEIVLPSSANSSSDTDSTTVTNINWARVGRFLSGDRPSGYIQFWPNYDLIDTLICANVWGEPMPCQKLRRIQTLQQASQCHTLFHDSVFWDKRDPAVKEIEEAMQKKPSTIRFGNQVTGDSGKLFELDQDDGEHDDNDEDDEDDERNRGATMKVDMATMEMIRIRLNFHRDDYANKKSVVGGRVAVHSNSFIGDMTHKAYHLRPGFWYHYYINRFDYQRLPPPYSTKCFDYDASRYIWLDRAKWLNSTREQLKKSIEQQAASPNRIVQKYVEILRRRSMGKVSLARRESAI